MSTGTGKSTYVKGILLGLPALVVAFFMPTGSTFIAGLAAVGMVFLVFGFLAGWVAPSGGWRAGAAVSVPLVLLLLLSVAFAGEFRAFLVHDAPVLVTAIAFGAVGGVLGAKVKVRRNRVV